MPLENPYSPPPWPLAAAASDASAIRKTITASTSTCFLIGSTPFQVSGKRSEPEVLQRVDRAPVEVERSRVVARAPVRVALRRPRRGDVARRAEALEQPLCRRELAHRLVDASLLEQRAPEHEVRVAALVDVVVAVVEDRQRVPRLLLGELRRAAAQVHLCKRRDRLRGVGVVAELERQGERVLEVRDRGLRLAEQEAQPAEVVERPRGELAVAGLV